MAKLAAKLEASSESGTRKADGDEDRSGKKFKGTSYKSARDSEDGKGSEMDLDNIVTSLTDQDLEKFYLVLLGDTAGIVPSANKQLAKAELFGMLRRMQTKG